MSIRVVPTLARIPWLDLVPPRCVAGVSIWTVGTVQWMRKRCDRVKITSGKYAGHTGTVESNEYQRTEDYPDDWNNGYHVMLDGEKSDTVRWEQVENGK